MGSRFLLTYYQTVLDFEDCIALVALNAETERVIGFAVGFHDPQGFYTLFRQRRKRVLPAILLAVFRYPDLLMQILRNMRRIVAQAQQPVDTVELSSIAVGVPGRGIGAQLLEEFVCKASGKGAHTLTLTTDADENDPVRGFYEARGFILVRYENRNGRRLCHYVRSLG